MHRPATGYQERDTLNGRSRHHRRHHFDGRPNDEDFVPGFTETRPDIIARPKLAASSPAPMRLTRLPTRSRRPVVPQTEPSGRRFVSSHEVPDTRRPDQLLAEFAHRHGTALPGDRGEQQPGEVHHATRDAEDAEDPLTTDQVPCALTVAHARHPGGPTGVGPRRPGSLGPLSSSARSRRGTIAPRGPAEFAI
jgi:hypothetical protein